MLVLPNSKLSREPNLLIPGKKPVGPVRVSPDLRAAGFWLLRKPYELDLVGAGDLTKVGTDSISSDMRLHIGPVLDLRNTQIRLQTSTSIDIDQNNFTFFCRVFHDTDGGDEDLLLAAGGTHAGGATFLFWRDRPTMRYGIILGGGAQYTAYNTATGEWIDICFTFSPEIVRIYFNGAEDANSPFIMPGVTEVPSAYDISNHLEKPLNGLIAHYGFLRQTAGPALVRELACNPYQFLDPA